MLILKVSAIASHRRWHRVALHLFQPDRFALIRKLVLNSVQFVGGQKVGRLVVLGKFLHVFVGVLGQIVSLL